MYDVSGVHILDSEQQLSQIVGSFALCQVVLVDEPL